VTAAERGHAALDLESRRLKAAKVAELLGLANVSTSMRVLEIGCGSGAIAHYFASHPARHQVDAVDVYDSRVVRDGYHFQTVAGTELPFDDATFDVVISNHVVEHVGGRMDQMSHLAEMRRVMKPGGLAYLAVPNRWRVMEPHYRLPFLSMLPVQLRSPYLHLLHCRSYDCLPLSSREIERMFRQSNLRFHRPGPRALKTTLRLERPGGRTTRISRFVPDAALLRLQPIMPTLVYELERR